MFNRRAKVPPDASDGTFSHRRRTAPGRWGPAPVRQKTMTVPPPPPPPKRGFTMLLKIDPNRYDTPKLKL